MSSVARPLKSFFTNPKPQAWGFLVQIEHNVEQCEIATRLSVSELPGAGQLQALLDIMYKFSQPHGKRAARRPDKLAVFICLAQRDGQSRALVAHQNTNNVFSSGHVQR
ncbi:hypothetical protein ACQKQC_25070 [Vibrio fortis]|uniref:hypothetical protein n=1 Tax=Vibrio fortis TaxID=212667 RepID=UPI004067F7F8